MRQCKFARSDSSNPMSFHDHQVEKSYHWPMRKRLRYLISGFFERKYPLWQSDRKRFEREANVLTVLNEHAVPTPMLASIDRYRLRIVMDNLTGTDQKAMNLRSALLDRHIDLGVKHSYLIDAFAILIKIHAFGLYHGDAMTKNFALNSPGITNQAKVHAIDFELSRGRNLDEAIALDIITLVADASNTLYQARPGATRELAFNQTIAALETSYHGFEIPKIRLTWRDRLLYRFGYGMGPEFFAYFSQ